TTGRAHAAVWLYKDLSFGRDSLDIDRHVRYCRKFGLRPSDGPFIVVTTINPDRWTDDQPRVTISFSGQSAGMVSKRIQRLNDAIAANNITQDVVDSEPWWTTWVAAIRWICRYFEDTDVSVDTRFIKVQRKGICGDR